jgi:hypothetical protein
MQNINTLKFTIEEVDANKILEEDKKQEEEIGRLRSKNTRTK